MKAKKNKQKPKAYLNQPIPKLVSEVYGPEDRVIATAQLQQRHGVYWLSNVWVADTHRGQHLGTKVVRSLLEQLTIGEEVYLLVEAFGYQGLNDQELIQFYKRFGFVKTQIPGILHLKVER